jgi:poly(A) polymerase
MRQKAPLITQVSWERIRDELLKILTENNPAGGIELLREIGVLEHILPEVTAMMGVEQPPQFHPEGDVYEHTILMLRLMKNPSPELALASLLHDIGKPKTFKITDRIRFNHHPELGARMAVKICKRLRLSNDQTNLIHALINDHLKFMNVEKMRESTLKRFLRQPHFDQHMEMHRLDCLASHEQLECYDFCKLKLEELGQEKLSPPKLISGQDLIEMGLKPGPVFSTILTEVEDEQLEGRISTTEEALKYVREKYT